ncbi:NAD(P)-dependent dehydrogenase (short-subunit alcohol dehydrogenase family) [Microvirga flocculans]|uniref:NAD(P)-dependent dehydrogenase (Short-subunit alcohol dehydrogenase family) n=1 Tax=Microvirga flocculans TaxID=217168 RepID=A0A7W6IBK6_9HYPH|nr:NAD(P)-dependent dehydrogenase (short-subunit alcohol dehydrogenase family) [Microvirga flocculans]
MALAEAGAHVTLVARSRDEIAEAAAALRGKGCSADHVALDITCTESVASLIASRDPYNILVNNAGMNRPKPMLAVSEDDFDTIVGLNVRATFFLSQAVARRLIDAGQAGSIINMSSQMGHVGAAGRSVYCASKFAIEGLTKVMAIELGPHGIRVNTICPTFIETSMTEDTLKTPGVRETVLSKIRIGRVGRVEDLMGAVLYLAGDASALVTGSALMVDGGWTAG